MSLYKTLRVDLPSKSYPILIGADILRDMNLYLPDGHSGKAFIVTDTNTGRLYAGTLRTALETAGVSTQIFELTPGEQSKSFADYQAVLEWIIEGGANRQSLIFALGGGVVGDLAGFVAASALRGIRFIQVPTSLLAQVDSSVGGKTGINTKFGKNLVGAFYQPQSVVIDIDTLKTLPKREILAGYAEIVKYGLLGDATFFAWLEANGAKLIEGDCEALAYAIERSCAMKAEIVKQDEFEETGLRALLNLGHTFAHALETACHYDGRLLHGEAVGIGLVLAARLSAALDIISAGEAQRVESHLKSVGMMTEISHIKPQIDMNAVAIFALMQKDKKATTDGIKFILLNSIGEAISGHVPDSIVLRIIESSLK